VGNIEFAWDRRKAQSNLVKHGVSFEEAQTVFLDEQARCLIVIHCYREPDSVIRLISARRATAHEEEVYWRLR
jgi:uncharacterized DUF497 family protein